MTVRHERDLGALMHVYRLTILSAEALEMVALPAVERLAQADYERAGTALARLRPAVAPPDNTLVRVRDALGELLFTEVSDLDGDDLDTAAAIAHPDNLAADGVVHVGSRVRVRDVDGEAELAVVPPEEADPTADRVSADSPLGRALIGRRAGEEVRFRAPGGVLAVTIVRIGSQQGGPA